MAGAADRTVYGGWTSRADPKLWGGDEPPILYHALRKQLENSPRFKDHDILLIHFAGEVLGRAKTDSDGISPHEFTRRVLEELHLSEIVDAVFSGKINSLGCREIHDGSDQKQMADEYKRKAKEYEVDYPITACFLKRMSDYYASTGHEDYLRSELGYL